MLFESMRGRRGLTLIEIMLLIVILGTTVAALVSRSWRPFRVLLVAYGAVFVMLVGLAAILSWHFRIALPLQLRTLDRLEKEKNRGEETAAAFARLRHLLAWIPPNRGLNVLLARIDREGPFRSEYLRLVETYLGSEPARQFLQRLAERGDPLAEEARDLLAQWKRRQET
jgi:hypothetical protein